MSKKAPSTQAAGEPSRGPSIPPLLAEGAPGQQIQTGVGSEGAPQAQAQSCFSHLRVRGEHGLGEAPRHPRAEPMRAGQSQTRRKALWSARLRHSTRGEGPRPP